MSAGPRIVEREGEAAGGAGVQAGRPDPAVGPEPLCRGTRDPQAVGDEPERSHGDGGDQFHTDGDGPAGPTRDRVGVQDPRAFPVQGEPGSLLERRGEEDLGDEPWVVVVVAAEQRWVDRAHRRPFDDGDLSYLAAA